MRAATTPAARREAGEDVQDAKDDLDATARRLGVSREKLEESIAAARKAERKEELREPLRELLDELRAADEAKNDDGDGEPPAKRKPAKRKPPAADAGGDDPDPPHVDDPPMREHWSERGVGAMLR
jgi:hypothetical protein